MPSHLRKPEYTLELPRYSDEFVADLIGLASSVFTRTEPEYISWLGGVHPDFRRQGIAAQLMERQHAWLAEHAYTAVETGVNQNNQAMAQVNLRHGFTISGARAEPHRTQILYYKEIGGSGPA